MEGLFGAAGLAGDDGDEGEVAGGAEILRVGEDFFLHAEVIARGKEARLDVGEGRGEVVEVGGEQGFFEVEGAGLAVEAGAVPIEDAVGGVAVLLDFHDEVAFADGVEASAGDEDAVTLAGGKDVEAFFDGAIAEFFLERCAGGAGGESGVDAAAGIAGEEIPHFGLGLAAELRGEIGGRVDLHGEAVAGVKEFAEQREARAGGRVAGAEDFGAVVGPEVVEGASAVGAGGDDALGFGAVYNFPSFADGLVAGQGAGELRRESAAAPEAFLVEGGEGDGTHGFWAV